MYSTTSMLRTIELILGIAPMSQYDAAATPCGAAFLLHPIAQLSNPYRPISILLKKNTVSNELSKKSAGFDFSGEDRISENQFNEVLWKGIKGIHAICSGAKTRSVC